jgi:hypothetical protein
MNKTFNDIRRESNKQLKTHLTAKQEDYMLEEEIERKKETDFDEEEEERRREEE